MAIVINGSGTVTGLAVGGLPDGTVDAGTLATNSVDSAELIDGAVDDSHMAAMAASKLSGTVATARMPAGSVVKDSHTIYASRTASSSTTAAATGLAVSITPTSASNKMIITLNVATWRNQAQTGVRLWLYRDIGGGGFSNFLLWDYYSGYGDDGSNDSHDRACIQLLDTTYDSTSSVTYKLYFALSHGSGTVSINQNTSSSSIYVQEIAV